MKFGKTVIDMGNSQASIFELMIKDKMAEDIGSVQQHGIPPLPLEPFRDLAYGLERALGVPQLTFIVDASFDLGIVAVVAIIPSLNRVMWRLSSRCSRSVASEMHGLLPTKISKPDHAFEMTVGSDILLMSADKPNPISRVLAVQCDDFTHLADFLVQYINDPRFGQEMVNLRKIALSALGAPHGSAHCPTAVLSATSASTDSPEPAEPWAARQR